jgi:hypothetical protein
MKKWVFIILIISSCNNDYFEALTNNESKIVVEGWIEDGDVPQVLLSSSIPISDVIDSTNVLNHVIRSAKITVSDGQITEVLRVRNNVDRVPPFVYYGTQIKGQTGSQYSLKIEYLDRIIEARTTIPKSVVLSNVEYVKKNDTDSIGYVFIKFDDPLNEKNYYQIATRLEGKESVFVPAFYGNLDDENFSSSTIKMQVNRGVLLSSKSKFQPFFVDGDTAFVKLRTMNKDAYDFWNSWQNEIVNGRNPIFPSNTSLKSNVKGAIGIWAGYGKNTALVRIPSKK